MKSDKLLFKYVSIDRAMDIVRNQSIRFTQANQLNDAFELLPTLDIDKIKEDYRSGKFGEENELSGLDKFTLGITSTILDTIENTGLLCLTEKYDIPLMWAHYADNHRGVVIGFDIDEGLALDTNQKYSPDQFSIDGKVEYSSKRLVYPYGHHFELMFHKDINWQYEKEYRIARTLNTLLEVKENIFVAQFDKQAIKCIIFGALSAREKEIELNNLLHEHQYRNVGLYKASLDDSDFRLDINYLSAYFTDESSFIYSPEEYKLRVLRDNLVSKGRLFKAMEIIPQDTELKSSRDYINLFGEAE